MRGLKRTRGLKFNHPGLDTIAISTGPHLVIQNDIRTADAHVLLVGIEELTVTITHTDVHKAGAKFFVDQLNKFPVSWKGLQPRKAEGLAEGEPFYRGALDEVAKWRAEVHSITLKRQTG
jgi:hypothetical protein